jgi:hypothetical protein
VNVFKPALVLATALLSACGDSNTGHFDSQKGLQRSSSGNAPLEGPRADDVINDVHHDRARQNYEDRRHRRYYGSWN